MMKKWKIRRRERKAQKKDLTVLIRKERADERKLIEDHYLDEMAKQRNRHIDAIEEFKGEHVDAMSFQRKEIESRFARIIVEYEEKIKRKDRQVKKSQKAWFLITNFAHKLYAKSQDAQINAEMMRDSRMNDYQKSSRLAAELDALIRTIESQTPHIEKLLSIKEIKDEERDKIIAGNLGDKLKVFIKNNGEV